MLTCSFALLANVFLFSFSIVPGGDVFEIYLNGHKLHQQFVHTDKGVKSLTLQPATGNDKLEVFYSHCGKAGTGRVITIRNEKNELLKEMKFIDGKAGHSLMAIYRKDIGKDLKGSMKLYYSSRELPAGSLLAVIHWNTNIATAAL